MFPRVCGEFGNFGRNYVWFGVGIRQFLGIWGFSVIFLVQSWFFLGFWILVFWF